MEPKRILIVDDESLARSRVRRFISELNLPAAIAEAEDGASALERIENFRPEVVVLDIQMPGLSGFEVLEQIEDRNFNVVFATAFDEFAIKAFEVSAVDYLLKPFSIDRFQAAMSKAWNKPLGGQDFKALKDVLLTERRWLNKLVIQRNGKIHLIALDQISCFYSADHCTHACSGHSEHILDRSLAWLEDNLDPSLFVRCHRNSIVSVRHIKSLGLGEESSIELIDGRQVPVSRSQRRRLKDLLSHARS